MKIEQARKAALEYLLGQLDLEFFADHEWPGPVYKNPEEYLVFIVRGEAAGVGATRPLYWRAKKSRFANMGGNGWRVGSRTSCPNATRPRQKQTRTKD